MTVFRPIEQRFWEKVAIANDEECWNWLGFINPKGYGLFHLKVGHSMVVSHRAAWMLTRGPLRGGQVVCHKCDNRKCCNPSHLFVGTQEDNIADMVAKGRQRTGSRPGRQTRTSKLTAEDIPIIRNRLTSGELQKVIAADFGVSQTSISEIKHRKTWDL